MGRQGLSQSSEIELSIHPGGSTGALYLQHPALLLQLPAKVDSARFENLDVFAFSHSLIQKPQRVRNFNSSRGRLLTSHYEKPQRVRRKGCSLHFHQAPRPWIPTLVVKSIPRGERVLLERKERSGERGRREYGGEGLLPTQSRRGARAQRGDRPRGAECGLRRGWGCEGEPGGRGRHSSGRLTSPSQYSAAPPGCLPPPRRRALLPAAGGRAWRAGTGERRGSAGAAARQGAGRRAKEAAGSGPRRRRRRSAAAGSRAGRARGGERAGERGGRRPSRPGLERPAGRQGGRRSLRGGLRSARAAPRRRRCRRHQQRQP